MCLFRTRQSGDLLRRQAATRSYALPVCNIEYDPNLQSQLPAAQVYFKQSDDLLRRLVATRSRIADTEAAIEVLLDQRRNGLVA